MKRSDLINTLAHLASEQSSNLNFQKAFTAIVKQQVNIERRMMAKTQPKFHIAEYAADYAKNFKNYALSTNEDMLEDVIRSDIAYVGDFHTLKEAKVTLCALLQQMLKRKRKITVALEMVWPKYQNALDRCISGKLTETSFLRKIKYNSEWGAPWSHYAPIFELAKISSGAIKLIGIDSNRDGYRCNLRDYLAARTISQETRDNPDRLTIAFMGDLHVARQHFPEKTNRQLEIHGEKRKSVIIYQNRSDIYWKLAEKGMLNGRATVVRLSGNGDYASNGSRITEYCVINTTPAAKCLSYLMLDSFLLRNPKTVLKGVYDRVRALGLARRD